MSALPGPLDFPCAWCGARAKKCKTPGGWDAQNTHRARFDMRRSHILNRTWVVRLLDDDERFDLREGDELLVRKYPYDAKVTVIKRISDGFEPECNQYYDSVEYVRLEEVPTVTLDGMREAHGIEGCGCFTCVDEVISKRESPYDMMYPMVVCEECGNKRCPKATYHNNECTKSNKSGQPGSRYGGMKP